MEITVPVIVSSFLITYFFATTPVTLKVNKLDNFLLLHSGNMQLWVMVLQQHINGAVVNICKYSNKENVMYLNSFHSNKIQSNFCRLTAIPGGSNSPTFHRPTLSPAWELWYQNPDDKDTVNIWNISVYEPPDEAVSPRRFYRTKCL